MAVGNDGNVTGFAYEFQNGHWSRSNTFQDVDRLNAVSCTEGNYCLAGGEGKSSQEALAYAFQNGSWSQPLNTNSGYLSEWDEFSCTSSAWCMAEGVDEAFTGVNGAWSASGPEQLLDNVIGVTCTTPDFCMAWGGDGSSKQRLCGDVQQLSEIHSRPVIPRAVDVVRR
jgi:hypothetical protein